MKIIIGLGNPGEKYAETRHNVGFMVVDKIAQNSNVKSQNQNLKLKPSKKFSAEVLKIIWGDEDVLLVKPQTFMNNSGLAVKKVLQYNHLTMQPFNNLYVVHDDLDIPLGEYKIQFERSSAGHHGIESIIRELKSQAFWRVRIGIQPVISNNQKLVSGADFVLQKFSQDETKMLHLVIDTVVEKLYHVV